VADKYDVYREALVMEEDTVWPEDVEIANKAIIHRALHDGAEDCASIEYVRTHTGFCRRITASAEDIQRVS
jgi:hypothetical protein|tara:strand:- start:361 stop:573 length:213 start_codon:yes stop_codon:yes gene_type:complete